MVVCTFAAAAAVIAVDHVRDLFKYPRKLNKKISNLILKWAKDTTPKKTYRWEISL